MLGIYLLGQRCVVVHGAGEHLIAQLTEILVHQVVTVVVAAVEEILVVFAVSVIIRTGMRQTVARRHVKGPGPENLPVPGFVDGVEQAGSRPQFPLRLAGRNGGFPVDHATDPQSRAPQIFVA